MSKSEKGTSGNMKRESAILRFGYTDESPVHVGDARWRAMLKQMQELWPRQLKPISANNICTGTNSRGGIVMLKCCG